MFRQEKIWGILIRNKILYIFTFIGAGEPIETNLNLLLIFVSFNFKDVIQKNKIRH